MVDNISVELFSNEADLAVFQFIELLSIISFLSIAFIFFLLAFLKNTEKNKRLENQNKEERLMVETITRVQESERNRISHDLHDTVTQDIRTALLFVHKMQNSPDFEHLTEEQKNLLTKVQQIEEQNLKNIRSIIRNLTPPEIESANFLQLISDFCTNTSEASGILCKFYAEKSELYQKFTAEQKLHIFRIVQESVNNAVKHSGASEISVIVREMPAGDGGAGGTGGTNDKGDKNVKRCVLFMISDDGHGIEGGAEKQGWEASDLGTHLGLSGMKSRATLLGAELQIKSDEESGTQVKLVVGV